MPRSQSESRSFRLVLWGVERSRMFIFGCCLLRVSKFTRVSLFSKLNNLTDLTINPYYASTMLGYTQEELEHYFVDYIDD